MIHLSGGNDGLNTVVPRSDTRYRSLRGALAITSPLALTSTYGLHPKLPSLKSRYDAGKVAIVHGVGQSNITDLSHFSSIASWMAGTAGTSRTTGWLGRWLDGIGDSDVGLRGVTMGAAVPLHLQGQRSSITAIDPLGDTYGADRSEAWQRSTYETIAAYGAGPTGKGVWADRIAVAGAESLDLAVKVQPSYQPKFNDNALRSQLTMAARLINLNLGIRVFNVHIGGFDCHEYQSEAHGNLLATLDGAIAAFYSTLSSSWNRQVTLMTFSEFGRTPKMNGSQGTDHGTSSVLFLIGENVRGGMHGEPPRLDRLNSRGDQAVTVDYRSIYASVLTRWLGGDATAILGGSYPELDLFRSSPGTTTYSPYSTTGAWVPFANPTELVAQQYLDLYGREGDSGGIAYWARQLTTGSRTIPAVIDAFLHSNEFGRAVAPVARMAVVAFGGPPPFDALLGWAAEIRAGATLAQVAPAMVARTEFTARYGALSNRSLVDRLYRDALGRAPSSTELSSNTSQLDAGTLTKAGLLAKLAATDACALYRRAEVEVMMTYAGLLRRKPDSSGWTYWVGKVRTGTSIQRLIAQFFNSSEYRRRFTA
jgi:uncharacterized protein (DUF1501 family)